MFKRSSLDGLESTFSTSPSALRIRTVPAPYKHWMTDNGETIAHDASMNVGRQHLPSFEDDMNPSDGSMLTLRTAEE